MTKAPVTKTFKPLKPGVMRRLRCPECRTLNHPTIMAVRGKLTVACPDCKSYVKLNTNEMSMEKIAAAYLEEDYDLR